MSRNVRKMRGRGGDQINAFGDARF